MKNHNKRMIKLRCAKSPDFEYISIIITIINHSNIPTIPNPPKNTHNTPFCTSDNTFILANEMTSTLGLYQLHNRAASERYSIHESTPW